MLLIGHERGGYILVMLWTSILSQHELRLPSACSGIKLLMTTSEVAQGWVPLTDGFRIVSCRRGANRFVLQKLEFKVTVWGQSASHPANVLLCQTLGPRLICISPSYTWLICHLNVRHKQMKLILPQ